jgi:hypothetical protein
MIYSTTIIRYCLVFLFCTFTACSQTVTHVATNADLSALSVSNGVLTPPFDPAVSSYEARLSDSGANVAVTATASDSGSTIAVQGQPLVSGATSSPIPVRPATMTITVEVTASDGVTHKNYVVTVQLWGWQLNETNTGLAGVGVDKNSLPLYTGPIPFPAGTTISMQKVVVPDGNIAYEAGNITFDRCWIVGTGYVGLNGSSAGNGPVTAQDCDIETENFMGYTVVTGNSGQLTVLRCNITGGQAGVSLRGNDTIRQSYVHGLISGFFSDGSPNHIDGFRRDSGIGQVNVIDCYIDATSDPDHTSATVFLPATDYFDNLLFQGNLFQNDHGYNDNCALENKGGGYGEHLYMDNNRFAPIFGGYVWDYTTNSHGLGWGRWTDNYVNDPSQPDNKGAVVPKP